MKAALLSNDFRQGRIDPRLQWFNEPPACTQSPSGLILRPAGNTDFWRKTHYGFEADNGHFLSLPVERDFRITTSVLMRPVHQYDQAGLMIRVSPECWLKTSIEFEPDGPNRLGVVVTNAGFSDWSTQDVERSISRFQLRIDVEGRDCTVHASLKEHQWTQIRITHLLEGSGPNVRAGLYACCPKSAGLEACFELLEIVER